MARHCACFAPPRSPQPPARHVRIFAEVFLDRWAHSRRDTGCLLRRRGVAWLLGSHDRLPRQRLDVLARGWARARGMLAGTLERHAREVQGAVA